MDPDHIVYVPASWYAFIPASGSYAAQWIDLYDVSLFDWFPDPVHPHAHITTRCGVKYKFQGERAVHLIEQWQLFRTKQPKRFVMEVS